jgi:nicotinamide/nicotinate riboside kinase
VFSPFFFSKPSCIADISDAGLYAGDSIDWPRQRAALKELRRTGRFPPEHESHDAFNEQIPVPISSELETRWREKFRSLEREKRARRTSVAEVVQNGDKEEEETVYILADGFLMLYDAESVKEFDVKLLVREDYETLKKRRDDRSGYVSRPFRRL